MSSLSDEDVRVYIDIIVIGFAKIVIGQVTVAPKSRGLDVFLIPHGCQTVSLQFLIHYKAKMQINLSDSMTS